MAKSKGRRRRSIKSRKGRKKNKRIHGGAIFKRRPTTVDKIAEGMSMALAGPAPTFASLALKLAGQAAKGVKDNVKWYMKGR